MTLTHDQRTALMVVLVSPFTVAECLYPNDPKRSEVLAFQLIELRKLLQKE